MKQTSARDRRHREPFNGTVLDREPVGGSRAFALERILPVHVVRLPNSQNYVLHISEEISKADGDNDKSWIDKIESAVSRRDEV